MHIHVYAYLLVRMCVCMHVCIYVCVYMHVYIPCMKYVVHAEDFSDSIIQRSWCSYCNCILQVSSPMTAILFHALNHTRTMHIHPQSNSIIQYYTFLLHYSLCACKSVCTRIYFFFKDQGYAYMYDYADPVCAYVTKRKCFTFAVHACVYMRKGIFVNYQL